MRIRIQNCKDKVIFFILLEIGIIFIGIKIDEELIKSWIFYSMIILCVIISSQLYQRTDKKFWYFLCMGIMSYPMAFRYQMAMDDAMYERIYNFILLGKSERNSVVEGIEKGYILLNKVLSSFRIDYYIIQIIIIIITLIM